MARRFNTSNLYFDGENMRDKDTDEIVFSVSDAQPNPELQAVKKLPRTCIPKASPTTAETFFVERNYRKPQKVENPDGSVRVFTHEVEEVPTAVVVKRLNVKASPTLQARIAQFQDRASK